MTLALSKSEFYFDLPSHRIAKYPLEQRDTSKLLVYNGEVKHSSFANLDMFLPDDTVLVMNNAKVIPARLYFQRETGALIEVLLLEPISPANYEEVFNTDAQCSWKCIIGNSKKWKEDEIISLHDNENLLNARLINRENRIVELSWSCGLTFTELLKKVGELPLPPYLNRDTEIGDNETYQTVFAKQEGSVAAPTAGLHFTEEVFKKLDEKNVIRAEITLHVGAGTFLPVKEENVLDHDMHREYFEVTRNALSILKSKKNRIAVGTTSLRVLESLYWLGVQLSANKEEYVVNKLEPYRTSSGLSYNEALAIIESHLIDKGLEKLQAATEILILPYYKLKSINGLITNFHLPESTLLMLIASVVGNKWKEIYGEALEEGYRFLSYGDSSLLFVNE